MTAEAPDSLQDMDAAQLRELAASLMHTLGRTQQELTATKTLNERLTFEIAALRRLRFGKRGEQLPPGVQGSLLEEAVDEDLVEIEAQLAALNPKVDPINAPKGSPRRTALPPELPRIEIRHEPHGANCTCGCALKFVRDEVSEKLDYTPGTFTVERHVRPVLACPQCETITQAPMPAYVIDKGLATPGLMAHVLVAKYADHLPLHRQEGIFARAGLKIARSTLAEWVGACGFALQPLVAALRDEILAHRVLHADETPVKLLKPGSRATHKAYLWAESPRVLRRLSALREWSHGKSNEVFPGSARTRGAAGAGASRRVPVIVGCGRFDRTEDRLHADHAVRLGQAHGDRQRCAPRRDQRGARTHQGA